MDFEDISDPESDSHHGIEENRETLTKCRQALGISRHYVPKWDSRDGFREFFQNWFDGMISTNHLTRDEIQITKSDTEEEWIATAHPSGSQDTLGYIRFWKKKGVLEITNFKAALGRKALDLGVSSKRDAEKQAGTHGEGFKVASLVMVRKGFQVRYESSNYYWSFKFGGQSKNHLYCFLSPMRSTMIERKKKAFELRKSQGGPRELSGNISEDVTVKIGRVTGSTGKAIDFEMFKDWIKVSIALHGPSTFIRTPHGDLILEKIFSGRMYLKGLYLKNNSSNKLKFGYNLATGDVNRDREQVRNKSEKAVVLANIWAEAIRRHEPGALEEYVKMLREDDDKHWDDVDMAQKCITQETASKIWQYLLGLDSNHELFYCSKKNEGSDSRCIQKHLKKIPAPLPICIWEPLRRFNLLYTPEEHRWHMLHNSTISVFRKTSYSEGLLRALSAALSMDRRTSNLTLVFKNGSKSDLDLLLDGRNLLINEKWLDFCTSHESAPCHLSRNGILVNDFPCDHVIIDLYKLVLDELIKIGAINLDDRKELYALVQSRLIEMPRAIQLHPSINPNELTVNWSVSEGVATMKRYGHELEYQVTLHRQSICADKSDEKLFCKIPDEDISTANNPPPEAIGNRQKCQCESRVVFQEESGTLFSRLSLSEKYFPTVARDVDRAFFGIPPSAIRPNSAATSLAENKVQAKTTMAEKNQGPKKDSENSKRNAIIFSTLQAKKDELAHVKRQLIANTTSLNHVNSRLQKAKESATISRAFETKQVLELKEALETSEVALRDAITEQGLEKSRLSSKVEDLQGEKDNFEERCQFFMATIHDQGEEILKLRTEIKNYESLKANEAASDSQGVRGYETNNQMKELRNRNRQLAKQNNKLISDLSRIEKHRDLLIELATSQTPSAQRQIKRDPEDEEEGSQESPTKRRKTSMSIKPKLENGVIDLTENYDLCRA